MHMLYIFAYNAPNQCLALLSDPRRVFNLVIDASTLTFGGAHSVLRTVAI